MSIYSRRKKAAAARKPAYTKTAVNNAYREVQTKMRKQVTKIRKIKKPLVSKNYTNMNAKNAAIKRVQDIGMKARSNRTKVISAAAKKHGVPKSQITAKKPINPGEIASEMVREIRANPKNQFPFGVP